MEPFQNFTAGGEGNGLAASRMRVKAPTIKRMNLKVRAINVSVSPLQGVSIVKGFGVFSSLFHHRCVFISSLGYSLSAFGVNNEDFLFLKFDFDFLFLNGKK